MLIKQMAVALVGVLALAACGEEDSGSPTPPLTFDVTPQPCFDAAGTFTCGEGTTCVGGICEPANTEAADECVIRGAFEGRRIDNVDGVITMNPGATAQVMEVEIKTSIGTSFDTLVFDHAQNRFTAFTVRDRNGEEVGGAATEWGETATAVPVRLGILEHQSVVFRTEVTAGERGVQFGQSTLSLRAPIAYEYLRGHRVCGKGYWGPMLRTIDIVEPKPPTEPTCAEGAYSRALFPVANGQQGFPGDTLPIANLDIAGLTIGRPYAVRVDQIAIDVDGWAGIETSVDGAHALGYRQTAFGRESIYPQLTEVYAGDVRTFLISGRIHPNARAGRITLRITTDVGLTNGGKACAQPYVEIVVEVLEPTPVRDPSDPCTWTQNGQRVLVWLENGDPSLDLTITDGQGNVDLMQMRVHYCAGSQIDFAGFQYRFHRARGSVNLVQDNGRPVFTGPRFTIGETATRDLPLTGRFIQVQDGDGILDLVSEQSLIPLTGGPGYIFTRVRVDVQQLSILGPLDTIFTMDLVAHRFLQQGRVLSNDEVAIVGPLSRIVHLHRP